MNSIFSGTSGLNWTDVDWVGFDQTKSRVPDPESEESDQDHIRQSMADKNNEAENNAGIRIIRKFLPHEVTIPMKIYLPRFSQDGFFKGFGAYLFRNLQGSDKTLENPEQNDI